ncbi:hypothetical protein [Mycobacteroides abscessus]|uniref:hypothetical protein n=1 Tax=Mycobacteroides abscessus TaxID=36809 RepID=UPI0012FFDD3D|nr:hypothetical protein [Mycobacteroides abscessus]
MSDVSKILADAWRAVEASKVPAQVREAAFTHAAHLLSGSPPAYSGGRGDSPKTSPATKAGKGAHTAPSSASTASEGRDAAESAPDGDTFYANLSKHTDVELDVLEDLFHYSPTKITLNVTGRQLGTSLKQKQQAAGVLLSVAYQYGLGHSTTSVKVIREECSRLRAVDHNLPTYLRDTAGIRLVGDSRVKDIQLRDAALDLFKKEAERIAGKSKAAE